MSIADSLVWTGLPAGAVSSHEVVELTAGWKLGSSPPAEWTGPADLPDERAMSDGAVPGTVAQAVGPDDLEAHQDYDAADWWYRCRFPGPRTGERGGRRIRLRFDGLATLAEVWLNGRSILRSENMFLRHSVDVTGLVEDDNELVIVFRSLGAALRERRPRPRWKTRLIEHQQLRWFRTTLLGRMPGWTPRVAPVGPWRSVWVETVTDVDVTHLDARSFVREGSGVVRVDAAVRLLDPDTDIRGADLRVGEETVPLRVEVDGPDIRIGGAAVLDEPKLWWPRTHGDPFLYECRMELDTAVGPVTIDLGKMGFREVSVDRGNGLVRFLVNGVPVFCRGACWTTNDIVSLAGPESQMRRTLELLAEAHANMVRVGGTMVYECDAFYRTCDELGIMVWQDFMFANMDYPMDAAHFRANVEAEAAQQLRRLQRHCSLVACCGGSEIEQQAAMFGATRDIWSNEFFGETLPQLVTEHTAASVAYWSSTPTGGALPFHVGEGLTHYYGVGAYRRSLEDVRLADVRFTPECLGFSNVPEASNLTELSTNGQEPPHHPAWKRGVPRDAGAGWDFEDVRDHYLCVLHGIDPVELRSTNLQHYLELSRTLTGWLMAYAFDEWRSSGSRCGGGLVWFARDLRPGAGWGIIDSDNHPKAAYFFLKRAWSPVRVRLLDRGLDGLIVEVENETSTEVEGNLEVRVISGGSVVIASSQVAIRVPPRSQVSSAGDDLLGFFCDLTYSYRFGPPKHEAVVATLTTGSGEVISSALYQPTERPSPPTPRSVGADAVVERDALSIAVHADGVCHDVRLDVRGYVPSDNYFVLTPDREYKIALAPLGRTGRFRGTVSSPDAQESAPITPPRQEP